jgi:hypothetical protein
MGLTRGAYTPRYVRNNQGKPHAPAFAKSALGNEKQPLGCTCQVVIDPTSSNPAQLVRVCRTQVTCQQILNAVNDDNVERQYSAQGFFW